MNDIFLSHSSSDKPFARRLGYDLRRYNATVWIDEAEIRVGDSLIEKISDGISESKYLIVLLSKASCDSEWVKREVNIALHKEINGRKLVVLPCLLEDCEIPLFLLDKKYADFRTPTKYVQSRSELISALGLKEKENEELFLDQHIFYDLVDLNDGFDAPGMRYFSQNDFEKVLNRIEYFGISINGIEPWPNREFYDVRFPSDDKEAVDSKWHRKAFKKLVEEGIKDYFSATYNVPEDLLKIF